MELSFKLAVLFIINGLTSRTLTMPLLRRNSKFVNPFVGFYVFPHGGIILDPAKMDYSTQPGFTKASSQQEALNLHNAMQKAADTLIQSDPELIIFSTPHGFSLDNNPVILSAAATDGDAGSIWENFTAEFQIDKTLSSILYVELKGAKNAIEILGFGSGYETLPIIWAEVIPWYFITEAAKRAGIKVPPAIYIGQSSGVNINKLRSVGRDIVKTALLRKEFANMKIAVVISGDLSHFHSNDSASPYPFSPVSSVFDKHIVDWAKLDQTPQKKEEIKDQLLIKAGNIQDQAGHCGYSGLVMLHGMLEEVVNQRWSYKSNLYAYEVPSYFGMMVAGWTPLKL